MTPTVVVDRVLKLGLQAGLVLLAVVLGLSASSMALLWSIPIGLAFIASAWWLWRLWKFDPVVNDQAGEVVERRTVTREFWRFTLPRTAASVFAIVVKWLDVLLVGGLISPRAAGIYAVSTRLLQFGTAVTFAIGQVSQPMLARLLFTGGKGVAKEVYATATSWQMLAVWPQFLFIALFAPTLLGLFGAEFRDGATTVAILAGSSLVASAAGPVDMVLLMAGRSTLSLYNTAASLVLNIALNLYLIPRIGINGAAVAWAASRLFNNIVPLVQVSVSLGLHPFGQQWVRAALSCVLIFGTVGAAGRFLVEDADPVVALLLGVVATVIYAGYLWIARERLNLSTITRGIGRRLGLA